MKVLKILPVLMLTFLLLQNYALAQNFNIYMVDVKTGEITQVTDLPDNLEFNASFSNNGKMIVCDVLGENMHDLYLTNVNTGESTPLEGGEGGNDASWSPNGNLIAFDRVPSNDPAIYTVPASGGDPTLVVGYGVDPEWAPNSQRIVFTDFGGALRTIGIDGTGETLIWYYGCQSPSWSPNGQYIAFTFFGHIFKVPVDLEGNVTGDFEPVFISPPDIYSGGPTWSNNSKDIVFFSNLTGDFDLWKIKADGTGLELLADYGGTDEYDPTFSKNGKKVVFSSLPIPGESFQAQIPNEVMTDISPGIELKQNYPNPFKETTRIDLILEEEQNLQIYIYDAMGRLVKTLANGVYDKGLHQLEWNGSAEDGAHLADGIYTCQMVTHDGIRNIHMILMRE